MENNLFVPAPINLNCWKHHVGFIKNQIASSTTIKDFEILRKQLVKIGSSQMDLYFGKHSPEEIATQIIDSLKRKKVFSLKPYQNWLGKEEKNYQLLELRDKSLWTLRLGDDPERYVHIHPGRYSPHTVRAKSTTLKTAIMILCYKQNGQIKSFKIETVNFIRKKYLTEPPIKSFSSASGLGRMINILSKKL